MLLKHKVSFTETESKENTCQTLWNEFSQCTIYLKWQHKPIPGLKIKSRSKICCIAGERESEDGKH